MALTINQRKDQPMSKVTVDRRLWLTADKERLVEDGDKDAAFLWATEGREVLAEEAEAVGYKAKAPVRDKARTAPANKQDESAAKPKTQPARSREDD